MALHPTSSDGTCLPSGTSVVAVGDRRATRGAADAAVRQRGAAPGVPARLRAATGERRLAVGRSMWSGDPSWSGEPSHVHMSGGPMTRCEHEALPHSMPGNLSRHPNLSPSRRRRSAYRLRAALRRSRCGTRRVHHLVETSCTLRPNVHDRSRCSAVASRWTPRADNNRAFASTSRRITAVSYRAGRST